MTTSMRARTAIAHFTTFAALATVSVTAAGQAAAAPVIATPYGCNSQVVVKAGYNGECARAVQWTMNAWITRTSQKITPLRVSGSFDATTTAVVKKFQAANGIAATGIIDAKSWPALIKEASAASGTKTPTSPATPPASTPTVSRVTTYPSTNVRSSASTSSSIVGTMKSGTALTGTLSNGWLKIATPTQYAGKYVSDSVLKAASSSPTTTPSTPKPPTTQPTQPMGQLKTPFGCNTRPTLNLGATGECVKATAYALNSWNMKSAAGLKILATDGKFTADMQTNLKAFQKAQGINQSGSVDAATWSAIEKASQGTAVAANLNVPTSTGLDHQAFPGAVKLPDGRLMAVVRAGTQHVPDGSHPTSLWRAYSPDNGYTWTTPEKITVTVPGTPAGAIVAYTDPSVSVPKTGRLAGRPVLTFFTYTFANASTTTANAVVPAQSWIVVANDTSGTSWGAPQALNFSTIGRDFMSSAAQQLDDDHFISAGYGSVYATEAASQVVMGAMSIGMMWDGQQFANSAPSIMSKGDASYGRTEPNIIHLQDGRLLGLIRVDPEPNGPAAGSQSHIFATYSSDMGKTWSPAAQVFEGSGNPHVTQLTNGMLVAAYRHVLVSETNAGQPKAYKYYAVYRTSRDGGATWSAEQHIGPKDSEYEMTYAVPVEYAPNKVTFVWGDESKGGGVSQIQIGSVDFN